jgi:hypothetical protein
MSLVDAIAKALSVAAAEAQDVLNTILEIIVGL